MREGVSHRIEISWTGLTSRELQTVLKEEIQAGSKELRAALSFEALPGTSPTSLHLDTGVLVAIITSGAAIVTSLLCAIANIAATKAANRASMTVTLRDGTSLTIPCNIDDSERERLMETLRDVREILQVSINEG